MTKIFLIGLGALVAWLLAKHLIEVKATVTVPEDEITIKPSSKGPTPSSPLDGGGVFDEDAPLPLGGLQ